MNIGEVEIKKQIEQLLGRVLTDTEKGILLVAYTRGVKDGVDMSAETLKKINKAKNG